MIPAEVIDQHLLAAWERYRQQDDSEPEQSMAILFNNGASIVLMMERLLAVERTAPIGGQVLIRHQGQDGNGEGFTMVDPGEVCGLWVSPELPAPGEDDDTQSSYL